MGVDAKVHINIKRNDFFLAFLLFSIEFNMPIHGFITLRKIGLFILLLLLIFVSIFCNNSAIFICSFK